MRFLLPLFLGAAGLAACASLAPPRDTSLAGDAERGRYVMRTAGCVACHTRERDGAMLAGGAPIATPFGTFTAPNITPHPDGLGNWSLDQFAAALTDGTRPDGGHYYPVFPYDFYTKMSDQDVVDLWAALQEVEPVAGKTPDHDVAFPFSVRPLLAVWKDSGFKPRRFQPVPGRSAEWNRGAYLVTGPGHCGACHSPRDGLGVIQPDQVFTGTEDGPDGETVPPITVAALKANGWTRDDLIFALRTGMKPDGDTFSGSMATVVTDGTGYWTEEDLTAAADYLLNPTGK